MANQDLDEHFFSLDANLAELYSTVEMGNNLDILGSLDNRRTFKQPSGPDSSIP